MPFSEKTPNYTKGFFDEVLKHLITPAAVKAGFRVETANKKEAILFNLRLSINYPMRI